MNHEAIRTLIRQTIAGSAVVTEDARRSCRAVLASLPRVANGLLARTGREVTIQLLRDGGMASTDGTVIYMSPLPIPNDSVSIDDFAQLCAIAYGLVHHEVGHIYESDFSLLSELKTVSPVAGWLFRVIEDVRMEVEYLKRAPQAKKFLDALNGSMVLRGDIRPVAADDQAPRAFGYWLLHRLYHEVRKDPTMADIASASATVVQGMFPPRVFTRLEALLPRMEDLEDSRDAFELACDIATMLEHVQQEEEQAQKDASPQGSGGDTSGNPNASDPSQGQGADATDAQGAASGSQDASQQSGATGQGGGGTQDGADDAGQDGNPSASGASGTSGASGAGSSSAQRGNLDALLDADAGSFGASDLGDRARQVLKDLVQATPSEGVILMQDPTDDTDLDGEGVRQVRLPFDATRALNVTMPLRRRLLREVEAVTEERVELRTRGQRLSARHLHRIPMGDARVFRTASEEIGVNTAIALLLDTSGSMSSRIEVACQAVFATAVAFESIDGVEVACAAFPSFEVFKPFGVRSRRQPDQFGLQAGGGTPMHSALRLGSRLLDRSTCRRKLLVCITDGEPDNKAMTKMEILASESQGHEVFGLGILTHSGEDLFRRWETIVSVDELPETLSRLLKGQILKAALAA